MNWKNENVKTVWVFINASYFLLLKVLLRRRLLQINVILSVIINVYFFNLAKNNIFKYL